MKYKSLGDAIGMPDEVDKGFIRAMILEYDKQFPGRIKHTIEQARKDQRENSTALNDKTEFGLIDKQSGRRHLFELPEALAIAIEKQYPLMFRDKDHFAWFCKNFKELLIPQKY